MDVGKKRNSYKTFRNSKTRKAVKISNTNGQKTPHSSASSSTSRFGDSFSDSEEDETVPILLARPEPPEEEVVDVVPEEGLDFYTIRKEGDKNHVPPVLKTNAVFDQINLRRLLLGVACSLVSGICMVASTTVDKYLKPKVSPWHVIMAVGIADVVLGLPAHLLTTFIDWNGCRQREVSGSWMNVMLGPTEVRIKTITQGVLGALSVYGLYQSIQAIKINDAEAIFYSTPILTFAFSSCLLGESFRLLRLSVSIILMAGLIFTTEPNLLHPIVETSNVTKSNFDGDVHVLGFIQSFCVPLAASLIAVMARKCFLQGQLAVNLVIMWMGIFILLTSFLASLWSIIPPLRSDAGTQDWIYVGLIALADYFGVWFFLQGQKYLSPSCTAVLKTVDVVIIVLIALTVDAEWDWSMLAGMFLLLVACTLMCTEELFKHKIPVTFKAIF